MPRSSHSAAAASSDLTLISRQLLAAPAADVSFTAIPASYDHLLLVAAAISDHGSPDSFKVTINSAGAGYGGMFEAWNAGGQAPTASQGSAWTTAAGYKDIAGSGSIPGLLELLLPNYPSTTFAKTASWRSGLGSSDSLIGTLTNSTTAAIDQLDVALVSGGHFIAGSLFSLYGLAA